MSTPPLIACALVVEQAALRRRGDGAQVLRTGMGPRAAAAALRRELALRPGRTAVVSAGFCGGLRPGMRPGDVVVADTVTGPHGATACHAPDVLAAALGRGRVHRGTLTASGRVVTGRDREAFAADGAVAVDMESAAVLDAAGGRAVAAVRVVVDAPGHELVRFGTLRGGLSAFRVLCEVTPAVLDWYRSPTLPRR